MPLDGTTPPPGTRRTETTGDGREGNLKVRGSGNVHVPDVNKVQAKSRRITKDGAKGKERTPRVLESHRTLTDLVKKVWPPCLLLHWLPILVMEILLGINCSLRFRRLLLQMWKCRTSRQAMQSFDFNVYLES